MMDPLIRDDLGLYFRIAILVSISTYTAYKINSVVIDPYLDEVFHIPQAQKYCLHQFRHWDSKITTPPGLYILSYLYANFVQAFLPVYNFIASINPFSGPTPSQWNTPPGAGGKFTQASLEHCSTSSLRMLNVLGGSVLLPWLVYEICLYVHSPYHQATAPPLRAMVVAGPGPGGSLGDPKELEKLKRQTELPPGFGPKEPAPGVDVVEGRASNEALASQTAMNVALFPLLFFFNTLFYTDVWSTVFVLLAYRSYLLYNPWFSAGWSLLSLWFRQTNIMWTLFFVILAATRVLKRLNPPAPSSLTKHQPLSLSATLGRASSGGIYDPPILAADVTDYFKSLLSIAISTYNNLSPVLISIEPYLYVLGLFAGFIWYNGSIALGDKTNHVSTLHVVQLFYFTLFTVLSTPALFITNPLSLITTTAKSLFGTPIKAVTTLALLGFIAGSVHVFTMTHPFMLADNRHYVFYIWRRTILAHPHAKYVGIPIYLITSFLVLRQLGLKRPAVGDASRPINPNSPVLSSTTHTITFLLAFVAATAGTLVFAPLVEFRYFILPWVMWRIHLGLDSRSKAWTKEVGGIDVRLWVEAAIFLGVHVVTTKIFLEKDFRWQGTEGIMRFMW